MPSTNHSRRRFAGATLALLAALPLSSTLAAPLAASTSPFVSSRISVRTEGSGPDVVLIPGLNSSPRAWATTVAALPGYRYHLVQLSGFGGQAPGANKEGAQDGAQEGGMLAPVADEIARYIAQAGLTRPAVVGHSMGGTIGMLLASRHPAALSRLMVVDMVPYLGLLFAGPLATPAQVEAVADRIATGMRAATPEQRAQHASATIAGMVDTESMRAAAVDDSLASDRQVGTRAFRELLVTDLRPALPKITVPVTVLYVQAKSVPMAAPLFDNMYKEAYAPLKKVTLQRIDGSAHFIMWDQPQRFREELKAFLGAR